MVRTEIDRRELPRRGVLSFGEVRIDLEQRTLTVADKRVPIQRKPLDVLLFLASESPRMISREELLRRFWSNAVNEESLTRCMSTIRKAIRDVDDPPAYIETHRAQGYRFIAPVQRPDADEADRKSDAPAVRHRWAAAIIVVLGVATVAWFFRESSPDMSPDRINRIGVLPVVVSEQENQWLSTALTDHMIRAVSGIEGISLVLASGVQPGTQPAELRDALDVEAMLLARLEVVPKGSRLSAQLMSTTDSSLLWSASVDSTEILSSDLQVANLARQLARRLRPMIQLQEQPSSVNQEAYSLYLRGRYYASQRSSTGLRAAIDAYEESLDIEPGYVDALVAAAEAWLLLPLYGAAPPNESIPTARALVEHALALEPESARGQAVLGMIAMQYDWDWPTARRLLNRAIAINPNDATAQHSLGELYCYREQFEDCARQLEVARDLDPLSPVLAMQRGSIFLWSGEFQNAVTAYELALADYPDYALTKLALGYAYAGLGQWKSALDAYASARPALGAEIVDGPVIYALARLGDTAAAIERLNSLEALAETRYVPPSKLAVAWLGLGDRRRALDYLQRALEVHDDRLVYFGVDVHTRDIKFHPDFIEITRALRLDNTPGS